MLLERPAEERLDFRLIDPRGEASTRPVMTARDGHVDQIGESPLAGAGQHPLHLVDVLLHHDVFQAYGDAIFPEPESSSPGLLEGARHLGDRVMRSRGRAVKAEARPEQVLIPGQPSDDLRPNEGPVRQELDRQMQPARVVHEIEEPGVDEDLAPGQVEEEGSRLPEFGHYPEDLLGSEFRRGRLMRKISVKVVAVKAPDVAPERQFETCIQGDGVREGPLLDGLNEVGVVHEAHRGLIRAPEGFRGDHMG